MTNEQPIWRIALKDPNHPLNNAAWTVFSPIMNPARAVKRLEPQKDEIIPFLLLLLDAPALANDDALGEGYAPINAVELLAEWKVEAVIPYLFEILTDEEHLEDTTYFWDAVVRHLPTFGPQIVPRLLDLADTIPDEVNLFLSIAAKAEPGNTDVYQWAQTRLEASDDKWDIDHLVTTLLTADLECAVPYLRNLLKTRNYPSEIQGQIEQNIKYHLEDVE